MGDDIVRHACGTTARRHRSRLLVLLIVALVTLFTSLTSCSRPLDTAIHTANISAAWGKVTYEGLLAAYEEEQNAVVEDAKSETEAHLKLAQVRGRYAHAFKAYSAYRESWLAVADLIAVAKSAQDTAVSAAKLLEAAQRVASAEEHLREAISILQGSDQELN